MLNRLRAARGRETSYFSFRWEMKPLFFILYFVFFLPCQCTSKHPIPISSHWGGKILESSRQGHQLGDHVLEKCHLVKKLICYWEGLPVSVGWEGSVGLGKLRKCVMGKAWKPWLRLWTRKTTPAGVRVCFLGLMQPSSEFSALVSKEAWPWKHMHSGVQGTQVWI